MECVICKNGTTQQGLVTVTLERNGLIQKKHEQNI